MIDENDNNPYFVTDITNVTVLENSKIGTEIAAIIAKDPDSEDYGKITYLLDKMSSQVRKTKEQTQSLCNYSASSNQNSRDNSLRQLIQLVGLMKNFSLVAGKVRYSFGERIVDGRRHARLGNQELLRARYRSLGQLSVWLHGRRIS